MYRSDLNMLLLRVLLQQGQSCPNHREVSDMPRANAYMPNGGSMLPPGAATVPASAARVTPRAPSPPRPAARPKVTITNAKLGLKGRS